MSVISSDKPKKENISHSTLILYLKVYYPIWKNMKELFF